MSSPLNFELTISDLLIPNYSGPIKCALVLANFSTTVSIPSRPINLVNVKIDNQDKMYLSVFTQSSEVGCLEIPYDSFASGHLESRYSLYENSISSEKERGQTRSTGEVYIKIDRLDDVCVRCEGLEKLVRDIKGNLVDIEDTLHNHPASVTGLNPFSSISQAPHLSALSQFSQSNPFMVSNASNASNAQGLNVSTASANQNPSIYATPSQALPASSADKKANSLQKTKKNKNLRSTKPTKPADKIPADKIPADKTTADKIPASPDLDLKKMLEESYKARKDLQASILETTEQLNGNLKDQREALDHALADRASAVDKLLDLNQKIAALEGENDLLAGKLQDCESLISKISPKINYAEEMEGQLALISDELEKSMLDNKGLDKKYQDSLSSFANNSNSLNKRIQDLTSDKSELQSKLEDLMRQNHLLKQENDRLNNLVNELCGQIALLQADLDLAKARESREHHLLKLLKEEQEAKLAYKKELDSLQKKFSDLSQKTSDQFSKLSQEKSSALSELNNLKSQQEAKDRENLVLKKDLEKANSEIVSLEQHLCVTEDLNSIIDQLSRQNQEHEKINWRLTSHVEALKETIEEQAEHITSQGERINDLELQKAEREEQLMSLENIIDELRKDREIYKPIKDDPIDIALSDYVNTRPAGIRVQFDREDHGIYNFGTKKIFVKLEQGRLLIRVGGGYMQVEDFVKLYSPVELERFSIQKKEQAQKIRQGYLGKYADSLVGKAKPGEISPERAAKILKDSMAAGNYTPYYAVQMKSPERVSVRSPVTSERISRTSSN